MAYKLIFDFNGRKFEFITPSLKEEDLQKAVKLKDGKKKRFMVGKEEGLGIMFYGIDKRIMFAIKEEKEDES